MWIPPMLAKPFPKNFEFQPDIWSAEEKFDGHRLMVEVNLGQSNLFTQRRVNAYSRYGLPRILPSHLLEGFTDFPEVALDGELLVPGKRSYGVTELVNGPELVYYVFDILIVAGQHTTDVSYEARRQLLTELFSRFPADGPVQLASSTPVNTWDEVIAMRDAVWARDGEGLILKRNSAPYQIGKRSKDFIKIKDLHSEVLTVIGFASSRGLINDRGPYAMTLLRDDEGNTTTVKTRTDADCRQLEAMAGIGTHPMIGRRLRIEFQERTPDGNYRHPRWDRWEDE